MSDFNLKAAATVEDYPRAIARDSGEISVLIDMLHGEIMKNREFYNMLDNRLTPIITSPEPMPDNTQDPVVTELGSRLREMINYLKDTNTYLNSLHNRIQL